jgi:hypothetical protein
MIRIVLLGRTGNNLYQYALGRVLSEKHGVPLVMDASWFNSQGWSEVSHFLNLPLRAKVVRRFSVGSRALRNLAGRHYWEYRKFPILRESISDQSFDQRFLEAPPDCMLFGYFQLPGYFEEIEIPLRYELKELIGMGSGISDTSRQMLASPDTVAVHVRRGDYLHIPDFQVCDRDYYKRCMQEMRARHPAARFFVFSDDPSWCAKEFRADGEVVLDSGASATNPLHDLHLMSLASHHIISNSSYSWWAAWLAKNPSQNVMMPDRWFSNTSIVPIRQKMLPHWEIVPTAAIR